VICIAKIYSLITNIVQELGQKSKDRSRVTAGLQSGFWVFSWIVGEFNECVTPWPILKNVAAERKKELGTMFYEVVEQLKGQKVLL